ncbi:uncharacterized protein LOC124880974 [Girardinichthys multiradiatus]|uniref:uncharacterized protein LOC124880974 n=1 Tax=Girardinichthys multiradiatus TaxID=208333 RepID=UPI001FAD2264|nr:uncharacterized protein LOC124880974 [Girardinichthys multiradiatus]
MGQVLISVLTAGEGPGLDLMAGGLVDRYEAAGVDPPVALYVDCGCCKEVGETKLKARFSEWPNLIVRLDIWHFMRRLAVGCTTDAHQLYPTFMARMSACIFEWDAADVNNVREAKRAQLKGHGWTALTEKQLDRQITKEELEQHCRRRTRGEEQTIQLLDQLIGELISDRGKDSLGVPLLDPIRMQHIWFVQKRHVKCIQDPPDVALYTQTGTIIKGGVQLQTLRCARGSTSLESFHCHLNRFIPGNSANSLNFQIYLLEGLHRWNHNRATAAVETETSGLRIYSGELVHSVNTDYERVFGKKLVPSFTPPAKYTGELIGVQYLLKQNNEPLQDMAPDSEVVDALLEQIEVQQPVEADEGFEELESIEVSLADLLLDTSNVISVLPDYHPIPQPAPPTAESPHLPRLQPASSAVVQSTHLPKLQPASSAVVQSTVSSGLPGQTTSSEQVAVDEHSRAGMDRVDVLAEYLVELRKEKGLTLTNQQANTIVGLWHKLEQNDKHRILYAARHQERLLTGRFRSPKKKAVYAGVESTKRCVLGSSGSAAQWPDCSRLIEMIFIRLCNIHSSPQKIGHQTFSRWSQILNDYKNIRQLILNNGIIMKDTTLQLVTVNQTTLIQWHNKRFKAQDVAILMQGLVLPQEQPIASEPLLPVNARPTQLTPHKHEHTYNLPPDTTGQAKTKLTVRDRAELKTIQPKPPASQPTVFYMPLHMPSTTAAGNNLPRLLLPPPTTPNIKCPPYSKTTPTGLTQTQETTQKEKRKYTRTVTSNRCTKCGEPRTTETGHSQYKGRIYCPNRETLTKEQWLRRMRK